MDKEKIIREYSSICYSCENARKPAAESNIENGWVGCCILVKIKSLHKTEFGDLPVELDNIQCREIGTGWVDLRSGIFNEESGIITNFQLITKGTSACNYFEALNE